MLHLTLGCTCPSECMYRHLGIQFDDSETDSDGKSSATKIPDELRAMFEPKQPYDEESQRSSSQDDDWQEKWFSHEDERMDLLGSELTVEVMRCDDRNRCLLLHSAGCAYAG